MDDLRGAARKLEEGRRALLEAVATPRGEDDRVNVEKRAALASVPVEKGSLVAGHEGDVQESALLPTAQELSTLFSQNGALLPPYDPDVLVVLFEHSNSLRPNVDAYATNIEAFGHRLEPVIDVDGSEAKRRIGDAIYLERLRAAERGLVSGAAASAAPTIAQAAYPTDEEIAKRTDEVRQIMRLERARLDNFFEHACAEASFTELREWSRIDLEITGNAFWEALRNGNEEVAQFVYVPTNSIRLGPIDRQLTEVTTQRKVSELSYEPVVIKRRFRRFLQIVMNTVVFFKEFGDPRVISRKTGRVFATLDELRAADSADGPATEIVHFRVHSSRTPYGVPRWIGCLLSVLGSRSSEEVNYLYFDNKGVPPIAVLVSGGHIAEQARKRLESYVKDHLQGKENFHKMLIIEAERGDAARPGVPDNGRTRIEIVPLTGSQQQDALFQQYDQNNIDKVGMSFRVPRLLRGDVRDFNRATADAALQFAEVQVFQPEREKFDSRINRHVLTDLRIRFWKFVSNSPLQRDPQALATMLSELMTAGALTPEDGRELAGDVFNREFKKIDEAWVRQPLVLTQAGIIPGGDLGLGGATPAAADAGKGSATAPTGDQQTLARLAQQIVALRSRLRENEAKAARESFEEAKRAADTREVVTLSVSAAEMAELVEPDAD